MFDLPAALSGTLRRMHYVQRYSSVPVVKPENVAEHSWQITMLAYLIGKDLQSQGITVFMEKLMAGALVHDVSESLSGDIIRSFKHSSPEMAQACKDADDLNMKNLMQEIGGEAGLHLYADWADAKDGSLEGMIVKLSDMLCVVSYCAAERRLGNVQVDFILKAVWEDHLSRIGPQTVLYHYVLRVFPNRSWDDPYDWGWDL